MLKSKSFSDSISEGFGPRFERVFGRCFEAKTHDNCKTMLSAKTSKIVLLSRRNANFQGFKGSTNMRFCKNRVPKIECFRGLDFEGFGGGFGQGLGGPKTSIFALFSMIFRYRI